MHCNYKILLVSSSKLTLYWIGIIWCSESGSLNYLGPFLGDEPVLIVGAMWNSKHLFSHARRGSTKSGFLSISSLPSSPMQFLHVKDSISSVDSTLTVGSPQVVSSFVER